MAAELIESREPASGELLGTVPVATASDVAQTIARARKAQAAWAVLPIEERCARLLRFRDALVARADDIVDVISRECGKPRQEALAHEVLLAVDQLTYYCKNAPRILAPRELPLHLLVHKRSTLNYVPRGVVGILSPWNFPFMIPVADIGAALVSGSAVVVKPSETTPLTIQRTKEVFDATGLPEDLLGVIHGGPEVGQALIRGGVQKLVFTGSVGAGRKVAAACGEALVPAVIELGGKAPLIACADCDLERTARAIVWGGFTNAGQACVSVERVYAHAAIHDELVRRVRELTRELRQGDPNREDVDVGAITFPRQIETALRQVEDALRKGAKLVAGGKRPARPGSFFEPTVLDDCDHAMEVMRDETFGPIVAIQRVGSDDEAVRLANDSPLGLTAYVFTKDREKGKRLAARIEAGSVVVNDVFSHYAAVEAPFGGTKDSGYGRVHGDDALRDMAQVRHVMTGRFPERAADPHWFPYSQRSYRWQLRGFRALFAGGGVARKLRALL